MFDNIGGKIKTLAETVCWLGIIGSIIYGFLSVVNEADMVILGFLIMFLGSLGSWVSSLTLYGFGQLIENTDQLVSNTEKPYSGKKQKKLNEISEDIYTEADFIRDIKKANSQNLQPVDFLTEIKETNTADLKLILQDQKHLYNQEEINIIEKELASRNS